MIDDVLAEAAELRSAVNKAAAEPVEQAAADLVAARTKKKDDPAA